MFFLCLIFSLLFSFFNFNAASLSALFVVDAFFDAFAWVVVEFAFDFVVDFVAALILAVAFDVVDALDIVVAFDTFPSAAFGPERIYD